jgi:hypothetical protein
MPDVTASASGTRQSYRELSRSARYSLTFALPLLLLYEGLAVALNGQDGSGIRNGADVLLRSLAASVLGVRGPMVMGAVFALALVVFAARDRRGKAPLRAGVFVAMLAESALLAVAFGFVVGVVTAQLLDALPPLAAGMQPDTMPWPTVFMVSLGAGIYEELVFRVLLVSGLLLGARYVFGMGTVSATVFAVVAGALIFSAFHYIGPYGDPLELPSFVFRTVAGLAFSGLYVVRGFGITAWTHALYDVFLLAARG